MRNLLIIILIFFGWFPAQSQTFDLTCTKITSDYTGKPALAFYNSENLFEEQIQFGKIPLKKIDSGWQKSIFIAKPVFFQLEGAEILALIKS